jgi:uncharacterized protein (TIGR02246 family)
MTDNPLLDELNRDIWRPFRRTYRTRDLEGFLALYDPELIRAGGPTKEVYGFDRFAADMAGWFTHVAERGDSLDIEFRFTERIAAGRLASERGYTRITVTGAGAGDRVLHGRFHVFARKDDGRWRIVADYDTDDDGEITPETFATGAIVEDDVWPDA